MRSLWANPLATSLALGTTLFALGIADAAVACARSTSDGSPLELGAAFATLALGAALGLLVAAPSSAIAGALTRLVARFPKLAWPLTCSLVIAFAVIASRTIHLSRIDWRAIDPWLPIAALSCAAAFAWLRSRFSRSASRGQLVRVSAALTLLGAVGTVAFLISSPHARSQALAAVDDGGPFLGPLEQRVAYALDRDHDGHPRFLCGEACDCDDASAAIHPLAPDTPGDGRDQNCDGRDASAAELARITAAFAPVQHLGQAPAPIAQRKPTRAPNVLLIVIDTLRVDHLGAYGYPRPTSPRIDQLAKRSVVFDQARSTGPSTRFSMPAMLTSKWFTEIKRNNYEWPAISESENLLGERLHDLGYTLAAFHSIRYFRKYFKLGQGFDHWSDKALDDRAPEMTMISSDYITDEALAWIDKHPPDKQKPFFLWTYYGDPHAEYMRHPGMPSFGNESVDRYDGEIAFADHHVGRLLDGLQQRGLTDDLVVILTSDHGEALDKKTDHGALNHSKHLYDELVHVPLMISGPEMPARRVPTVVSLLDVLPTLLELAHAPSDPELRGVSLAPWLRGEQLDHGPVFFEKHRAIDDPQKGMVAWPYKVILTVPTGRMQIYDLAVDPRERVDVYKTLAVGQRDRLTGMLTHWVANVLKPARDNWRH